MLPFFMPGQNGGVALTINVTAGSLEAAARLWETVHRSKLLAELVAVIERAAREMASSEVHLRVLAGTRSVRIEALGMGVEAPTIDDACRAWSVEARRNLRAQQRHVDGLKAAMRPLPRTGDKPS